MKEIRIKELNLRNFKGVKDFTLKLDGNNANIYGENETGKTSLMDAFIWLLFNKDSQNSSQFSIKTLDEEGNVIHGLEHEVSAKLDVSGTEIELKKIYKENWVKKRGQSESELSGHTTDYFINEVPKKQKEYNGYLENIISEDKFMILTNPLYFNVNLNWRDRRNLALKLCEEVPNKDIFTKEPKLKELKPLLENKTIDELKDEMKYKRRKLNEELKAIPSRIDELSRMYLKVDTKALKEDKKALESELNSLKSSDSEDYEFQLRGIGPSIKILENELKDLERESTEKLRVELDELRKNKSNIEKSYYESESKLSELKRSKDNTLKAIEELEKETEELRKQFKKTRNTKFDDESIICPTCKQDLPKEEIERMVGEFENNQKETLGQINLLGKKNKEYIEKHSKELKELEVEIKEVQEEIKLQEEILKGKNKEIEDIEKQLESINISDTKEHKVISNKLTELDKKRKELEKLAKDQDSAEEILELENKISAIDKELAREDLAKDNDKRVEELKNRERELAQSIADTEKVEFMCDEFIITKANLLEDNLNSKFNFVKFKLFDIQVNGGINETFVTTVDGVPFEDLNNAKTIQAGLDIISTLSDIYDFKAPIFLDNRESVNEIPEMDAQVINLIVSNHKNLNVKIIEEE